MILGAYRDLKVSDILANVKNQICMYIDLSLLCMLSKTVIRVSET